LQLDEVERLYQLLWGQTIHAGALQKAFDRSTDKGVIWNPAVFYLLDAATKRDAPWRTYLSTDTELREALEKADANDG
jgi:hypothetical protein